MPAFTYTGETERIYPDFGLLASPGETHDLPSAPGPEWVPAATTSAPAPQE